jgi:signal transduction histidine kinase
MRTLIHWSRTLISLQRPFLLGAVLSAAVGVTLYSTTATMIEKDSQERFIGLARTAHYTILRRVKSYADVLRSSSSLFLAAPDLTREQFHRYVEGLNLETEFPGVETINYAQVVTDAERPAFERRMTQELAAKGIKEFKFIPPDRHEEYLVMTYIEPQKVGFARFGLDLLQSGSRQTYRLFYSRDTGAVAASGIPIKMPGVTTGLGMRLPVYRAGMPTTTVAARRAAYIGSVGIAFNVERLMRGVLAELPVSGMRTVLIGLLDPVGPGAPQTRLILYDSLAAPGVRPKTVPPGRTDEFSIDLPVEFSQRSWEVHFRIKKAAMLTGLDSYVPWLALLAGFVSTALLYALFHALSSSRARAIGLAEEMTKELRASEANLRLTNAKLRQLAEHAENIKEVERKRIAREIHDDLGQNLLALRIEADLLASRTGERHPLLHERARRTLLQIDSTIKSVRQIINDLRPNVLDLGLNAAVDWQIEQFEARSGIACQVIENDHDIQISDRAATALFRILQESLTNISRHANASRVRVELRVADERISMTVSDNGRGVQPGGRHKPGSFGLVGIEERVKILGGSFTIGSSPATGTTISVSLPLDDAPVTRLQENTRAPFNPVETAIL